MWIFFFSAQLLPMFNPVLCSYLMEFDSENFIYMCITVTALGLLFIPCMTRSWEWLENNRTLAWSTKKANWVVDDKMGGIDDEENEKAFGPSTFPRFDGFIMDEFQCQMI